MLPGLTGATRVSAAAPAGGSIAPWQLAASSALTTAVLSVVGATAPELRTALGVGTAALTLAWTGQMLGALAGSWIAGRAHHPLLEISPLAVLAAAALLGAAFAPSLALLVAAMCVAGLGAMAANAGSQAETMRRAGPLPGAGPEPVPRLGRGRRGRVPVGRRRAAGGRACRGAARSS